MNMNSPDAQRILEQIKQYRQDLSAAEDLLREGKFDSLNELLNADLFHFCKEVREEAEAEFKKRTQAQAQRAAEKIQQKYEAMMAMQGLKKKYEDDYSKEKARAVDKNGKYI